jgi:hypothetical protein
MMLRALNARLARVLRGGFGGAAGAADEESSDEEFTVLRGNTPSAAGGGPDVSEVGTLPLVGAGSKSIRELSTEMLRLGYSYATLTDKTALRGFRPALEVGLKPNDALFFSKLDKTWNDDFEEDGFYAPAWYTWLQQNPLQENYSIKNIMFAKFDPGQVIDLKRDAALVRANYTPSRRYFDWPAFRAAGFKGIKYDQEDGWYCQFSGWDVPTLAIWDATALCDVKLFVNAGAYAYSATGQDVAV